MIYLLLLLQLSQPTVTHSPCEEPIEKHESCSIAKEFIDSIMADNNNAINVMKKSKKVDCSIHLRLMSEMTIQEYDHFFKNTISNRVIHRNCFSIKPNGLLYQISTNVGLADFYFYLVKDKNSEFKLELYSIRITDDKNYHEILPEEYEKINSYCPVFKAFAIELIDKSSKMVDVFKQSKVINCNQYITYLDTLESGKDRIKEIIDYIDDFDNNDLIFNSYTYSPNSNNFHWCYAIHDDDEYFVLDFQIESILLEHPIIKLISIRIKSDSEDI